jgi:leader peptidase (prepilin peptidase)/N-methyltransferase
MSDTYMGLPLEFWTAGPWGIPFHLWSFFIGVCGLMVGSFLNVVIHRMPIGESIVTPPSHCPKCGYQIPMRLNLPVISWLWLRGRCAQCRAAISPRYLLIELLTGALFLGSWLIWGHETPGKAGALCILWAGFIAATWIDLEHFIIPDEITLGGTFVGIVLSGLAPSLQGAPNPAEGMKLGAIGAIIGAGAVYAVVRLGKLLFGRQKIDLEPGSTVIFHENGIALASETIPYEEVFYRRSDAVVMHASRVELADRCYWDKKLSLELRRDPPRLRIGSEAINAENEPWMSVSTGQIVIPREAMGLGDVKFMAAIGAFIGWQATLFSLFASAVLGSIVGVGLIAIGRREWSARLPYGPFIALAATLWVFGARVWVYRWLGFAP